MGKYKNKTPVTAGIVLYFIRFTPLFQTLFIRENLFIVLLLLEFQAEQYEADKQTGTGLSLR